MKNGYVLQNKIEGEIKCITIYKYEKKKIHPNYVVKYYPQIDNNSNYLYINYDDITKHNKLSNLIIYLPFEKILSETINIYKNGNINENLINQLEVDYNRMYIMINDHHYDNHTDYLKCINNYCDRKLRIDNILLLLSNQGSFYYQHHVLHNIYSNEYLNNIHIIQKNDIPTIIINIDNKLRILFKKKFKLLNTNTQEVINEFNTYLYIKINIDEPNIDSCAKIFINPHITQKQNI